MKACRYCLKTDGFLSEIKNTEEHNFIQEIFVQNGFQNLSKNNYVCYMCKYLLNKSYKFFKRALRAQEVLNEILENNNVITKASLQNIDRENLDLDVKLTFQENPVNLYLWGYDMKSCDNEVVDNMFIMKQEHDYGSETFLTPMNYPEVVYGQSGDADDHDFKIDIKVEKPLCGSFTEVNIDSEEFDVKPMTENSNDSSDSKSQVRKNLGRKCKVKKEGTNQNKRNRPSKQKRKKNVKIDYRKYPMKCDDCDHMIQTKMEHFHHYLSCHKGMKYPYGREGNYVCQHCGVTKTSSFHLSQHELTHGDKNVECTQCGKKFHNIVRLQRHARRHEPVPKFRCHFCGKGFYAREDIQLHIRTHTGEKPFQCWLCPARFAHKGNVSVHVRNVHQRDAPAKNIDALALSHPSNSSANESGLASSLASPATSVVSSMTER